jgi:hypothetical protein
VGNENRGHLIAVDAQQNLYVTEDRGTQLYVRKLITDDEGLNPFEDWRVRVDTSNNLSPGIAAILVQDEPDGRVLTMHAVSGGVRSIRKSDGAGLVQTFGAAGSSAAAFGE